jgi:hypothetical protein
MCWTASPQATRVAERSRRDETCTWSQSLPAGSTLPKRDVPPLLCVQAEELVNRLTESRYCAALSIECPWSHDFLLRGVGILQSCAPAIVPLNLVHSDKVRTTGAAMRPGLALICCVLFCAASGLPPLHAVVAHIFHLQTVSSFPVSCSETHIAHTFTGLSCCGAISLCWQGRVSIRGVWASHRAWNHVK